MTESLITQTSEKFITIQMGLTVAEQKLIRRLRQLSEKQYRSVFLVLRPNGFQLSALSQEDITNI